SETKMVKLQADSFIQSQCYVRSLGKLSCVDCHDPHANVSKDIRGYESVCLRCHMPGSAATDDPSAGKPCPVNAKTGCIECHMPSRRLFPNTALPTRMADHLIRVHRDGTSADNS